jgi:NADH-quinone oxidoreductase subunit N
VFTESGVKPNFGPGLDAMLFYLVVYALATTGAFAALAWLSSREREVDSVDELAGLSSTNPLAAAALGVCMFSLTGIPPLAGFWGKLSLFGVALDIAGKTNDSAARAWLIALAVIGALNAAVGAAYYLRIVGAMYFRSAPRQASAGEVRRERGPSGALAAAMAAAVLVAAIGVLPGWLVRGAQGAGSAAVYTSNHYQPYKQPQSPDKVAGIKPRAAEE